jgi:hypothetical protein
VGPQWRSGERDQGTSLRVAGLVLPVAIAPTPGKRTARLRHYLRGGLKAPDSAAGAWPSGQLHGLDTSPQGAIIGTLPIPPEGHALAALPVPRPSATMWAGCPALTAFVTNQRRQLWKLTSDRRPSPSCRGQSVGLLAEQR